MFEIRELTGQQYVDEYATRQPDSIPSQPTAIVTVGNGHGGNGETAAGESAVAGATAGSSSRAATR